MNTPHSIFRRTSQTVLLMLMLGRCETPPPPSLGVSISSPLMATVHTNSPVTFQVTVTGGTPDSVDLLRNETLLVTLTPPYQYVWDTTQEAEGTYVIQAQASLGTRQFRSSTVSVVVDRTPPTVLARSPEPGAAEAWTGGIQATFSERLAASTVNDASVLLLGGSGTAVPKTLSLSANDTVLDLELAGALSLPTTLGTSLLPTITDLAGNPLQVPVSPWLWSVPQWRPLGTALEGGWPVVALDGAGRVYLAIQMQGVFTWTKGTWQRLGVVPSPWPNPAFFAPSLALDSSGKPVIAFFELGTAGNAFDVYVHRWDGSAWQQVGLSLNQVIGNPGDNATRPSLALDSSGNPIVALVKENSTHSGVLGVYVARWDGSAWAVLGSPRAAGYAPSLAVDASDHPVVTYGVSLPGASYVRVDRWDGSAWQSLGGDLDAVPGVATNAMNPAILVDGTGTPVVAWTEDDDSSVLAYVRRWTGSAWEPLGGALGPEGASSIKDFSLVLSLARGGDGQPVLSWCGPSNEAPSAVHVVAWSGVGWNVLAGTPVSLSASTSEAKHPSLALDGLGNPVVAYDELNSGVGSVRVRSNR